MITCVRAIDLLPKSNGKIQYSIVQHVVILKGVVDNFVDEYMILLLQLLYNVTHLTLCSVLSLKVLVA